MLLSRTPDHDLPTWVSHTTPHTERLRDPWLVALGSRLRLAREHADLPQAVAASTCGWPDLTQSKMSALESGGWVGAPVLLVRELAQLYQEPLSQLLGDLTAQESWLLDRWRRASVRQQLLYERLLLAVELM